MKIVDVTRTKLNDIKKILKSLKRVFPDAHVQTKGRNTFIVYEELKGGER